jgi:HNH endonuclease
MMHKLTEDAVAEIRSSSKPASELAARYDVTAKAIYDARAGFTHRDGKPMPKRRQSSGRPRSVKTDRPKKRSNEPPRKTRWSNEKWTVATLDRTLPQDRGYDTPCLVWQGPLDPVTRYATTSRDGKCSTRHRLLFEYHHGVALDRKTVVDHLCDQRDCLNIDHLRPTTYAGNTQRARSPLTAESVRFIRTCGLKTGQLAKMFNMAPGSIYKVREGLRWANVA